MVARRVRVFFFFLELKHDRNGTRGAEISEIRQYGSKMALFWIS